MWRRTLPRLSRSLQTPEESPPRRSPHRWPRAAASSARGERSPSASGGSCVGQGTSWACNAPSGWAQRLRVDELVSPGPTDYQGKAGLAPWGQATPPSWLQPSPARVSPCRGDVILETLPVFRSGKCSGGSREVLGMGGRKVLSTGGEGPSGSRGSGDLQGEATSLETMPCWQPRAIHATLSNVRVTLGHCLSWVCASSSASGQKGLSCLLPQAPTEGMWLLV